MKKRERIIRRTIKPLCKIFKIKYDYLHFNIPNMEILYLNEHQINCTGLSPEEIRNKVIGYIFVEIYCKTNSIGAFQKQTLNVIKKDWIE